MVVCRPRFSIPLTRCPQPLKSAEHPLKAIQNQQHILAAAQFIPQPLGLQARVSGQGRACAEQVMQGLGEEALETCLARIKTSPQHILERLTRHVVQQPTPHQRAFANAAQRFHKGLKDP
jgi:hypothetical protein